MRQRIVRHVGIATDDEEEAQLRAFAEITIVKEEQSRSENASLFSAAVIAQGVTKKPRVQRENKDNIENNETPDPLQLNLGNLVEEGRRIQGIGDIFGSLYDELGMNTIVRGAAAPVLKSTVLARLTEPTSKRKTQTILREDFGDDISLDRIYRMMDALYERRENAEKLVRLRTFELFGNKVDVCFFDVTTLYFESTTEDSLRGFGYSKDQKFHQVQVVLALLTTAEGLPVGYKLFPGSTAEISTLVSCVENWKQDGTIGQVTVVADRGMMSENNLVALEKAGFRYIVGSSLKKLTQPLQTQVLASCHYALAPLNEDETVWIKTLPMGNGRRLIATFNPKRARKDASDRKRLIESLEKRIGAAAKAPLKRLVSNRGYIKYTKVEGQAHASIDTEKLESDAKWDGMYGVLTNVDELSALEILARYRQLWTVEEAFRISKHDLKMRPIFHWKMERIEAHIAICFIAYALLRHVQCRLRRAGIRHSVDVIRSELARVEFNILRDTKTGRRYRIPSNFSDNARRIYATFGHRRAHRPALICEGSSLSMPQM